MPVGVEHDSRKKQFKNAGKHEEMRRRRAEGSLELRKARKDDVLMKRRNFDATEDDTDYEDVELTDNGDAAQAAGGDTTGAHKMKAPSIEKCVEDLRVHASDEAVVASRMETIRKILSKTKQPPVSAAIAVGVLPLLIAGLNCPKRRRRSRSAWRTCACTRRTRRWWRRALRRSARSSPRPNSRPSPPPSPSASCRCSSPDSTVPKGAVDREVRGRPARARVGRGGGGVAHGDDPQDPLQGQPAARLRRHRRRRPAVAHRRTQLPQKAPSIEKCVGDLRVHASDEAVVASRMETIRKILSKANQPPVSAAIAVGVLPLLIAGLNCPNEQIQFDAAWALTNVVSGTSDETRAAVDAGVVAPLIVMLGSPQLSIAEQSCWALGNIIGDNGKYRDIVVKAGIIEGLTRFVHISSKISVDFQRTIAWTVSNLCRHKDPRPDLALVAQLLPFIRLLFTHTDLNVVVDTCWALSYLSDGSEQQIGLILREEGILHSLMRFLQEGEAALGAPVLRTLGNFVTGDDRQTQAVIDAGLFSAPLAHILEDAGVKNGLKKEACWLLSNIIAGTHAQIQTLIDNGLLFSIVKCLDTADSKTRFEASWCLANLGQGGTEAQISSMVDCQAIPVLCRQLNTNDPRMAINLLDALGAILATSANSGKLESVQDAIEEAGGLDHLEHLQTSAADQVYEKAVAIIETYFQDDDEEEQAENKENFQPSGENFSSVTDLPSGGFKF